VFVARSYSVPVFNKFKAITIEDVRRVLMSMPNKSSSLDVVPTLHLKLCVEIFSLIIGRLANLSFVKGVFTSRYKVAQVLSLLKKLGTDHSVLANYRQILNLSKISKVLKRLSLAKRQSHLLDSVKFLTVAVDSLCRTFGGSSTCPTPQWVYTAGDENHITFIVRPDISTAFDNIRHETLNDRLNVEF